MTTNDDQNILEVYNDYTVIHSCIFICTCWFYSHSDIRYINNYNDMGVFAKSFSYLNRFIVKYWLHNGHFFLHDDCLYIIMKFCSSLV